MLPRLSVRLDAPQQAARSKGLFAGVVLDGSVLELDNNANSKVYGKNIVAMDRDKRK
jgi:lipid-binding SYLF domain-containing protein